MSVSPGTVQAGQATTLVYTFTAPTPPPSGEVTVEVPAGWTAPSPARGQAGYTSASGGRLTLADRQITVTGVTLLPAEDYPAGSVPGARRYSERMS